jgi:nucleotide-binding universal stress UspA family protein
VTSWERGGHKRTKRVNDHEAAMIEIQRILCPIDFSDHSRRALRHAIAIARWYEAKVTALYVFSPVPGFGPGPVVVEPIVLSDRDRDRLVAEAKAFIEAEPSACGVTLEAAVREGNVATEILDQADAMKADLVVIGTHGRSAMERFVLGSVAERVLRKAACPVLTVPRSTITDHSLISVLYKHILCPIDFSDSSLHALQWAMALTQEADGMLTVLHVVAHEFENTVDMANIAQDTRMTVSEYVQAREEILRRRLQDAVANVPEFLSVETRMTHGKPWRDVLRVAAERETDLIVMGVHGRAAADLLLFGSTTQHVVREAACPVRR